MEAGSGLYDTAETLTLSSGTFLRFATIFMPSVGLEVIDEFCSLSVASWFI